MFNRFVVIRLINSVINNLSWHLIGAAFALHALGTWLFLRLAEESVADNLVDFVYFLVVTVSTAGYGDLSPETPYGKMAVSFYTIPFGIIVFTALIGKLTQLFMGTKEKLLRGHIDLYDMKGHILLLGWTGAQTTAIIESIFHDKKRINREVVLVTDEALDNPLANFPTLNKKSHYCSVGDFIADEDLERISAKKAYSIIVNAGDDNKNLLICTKLQSIVDSNMHIVVHMTDPRKQAVLRSCCPNVEVVGVNISDMIVRAMQDPGTATSSEHINSNSVGATQRMLQLPGGLPASLTFGDLKRGLEGRYSLTLLGMTPADDLRGHQLVLNPQHSEPVTACARILYLRDQRIQVSDVDWSVFDVSNVSDEVSDV